VLSLPVSLLKAQRNIAREECRSGWGWGKTRGFRRAQKEQGGSPSSSPGRDTPFFLFKKREVLEVLSGSKNVGTRRNSGGHMKEKDPLKFLKSVYSNTDLPLSVRMRAAIEVLPFIHPKLAVTAQVTDNDLATLLDRRIAKFDRMKLIGASIEAKAIDTDTAHVEPLPHDTNGNGNADGNAIEPIREKPTPAPLTRLYSNKFRGFLRRA
jgi:hypothetical protein